MLSSYLRTSLAAALAASLLTGLSGCVVAPVPTEVTISGPAVYYYTPLYYDGYVVYYDGGGRPYYYQNGINIYISSSYHSYQRYVTHYHQHRPEYRRWYDSHGVNYHQYRDPQFRAAPAPRERTAQPAPDRFSPPSRMIEREPTPVIRDRTSPARDDWAGRSASPSPRFERGASPRESWDGGTASPAPRFERSAPDRPSASERGSMPSFPDRMSSPRESWGGGGASPSPRFERSAPSPAPDFDRGAMSRGERGGMSMDQGRFSSPR